MLSDALNGLRGHLWQVVKLGRDKWQKDDFCCLIYAEKNFEVFRHKELHFPAVSLLLWSFLLPCAVLSRASGFNFLDLGRFSFWGLIGKTWAQVSPYLCSDRCLAWLCSHRRNPQCLPAAEDLWMWSPHLTLATVCNTKTDLGGKASVQREIRLPRVSSLLVSQSLNCSMRGWDAFFPKVVWWFKGLCWKTEAWNLLSGAGH